MLAAASVLLWASPAAAFHIPGATYNGTHSGGGTVTFQVSGDGSSIASVTLRNIPGDNCTFTSASTTSPSPIVDNAFDDGTFRGSFGAVQSASGTLRIQNSSIPCDTGNLSWTARTTASPAGSEECVAATAAVKKAKSAVKKAKKAVKKAKKRLRRALTPQQKQKAKKRLRKAKKRLAKAKKKLSKAKARQKAVCG